MRLMLHPVLSPLRNHRRTIGITIQEVERLAQLSGAGHRERSPGQGGGREGDPLLNKTQSCTCCGCVTNCAPVTGGRQNSTGDVFETKTCWRNSLCSEHRSTTCQLSISYSHYRQTRQYISCAQRFINIRQSSLTKHLRRQNRQDSY